MSGEPATVYTPDNGAAPVCTRRVAGSLQFLQQVFKSRYVTTRFTRYGLGGGINATQTIRGLNTCSEILGDSTQVGQ